MRLRVVTWNIHKGIGGIDRRYALDRTIAVLRSIQPDLALLQEVTDHLPRTKFHDQAEMLAHAVDMRHWAFHPEHRFAMGGYGNAILSRWPLSNIHHVDLTVGWRKKRGVLQARARVRLPRGRWRSVIIQNLHLGLAGTERGQQLERFLASAPFARLHERTPVIVGGDLNDLWGTLGARYLHPRGFERAGSLANTFPAALPARPLDGLFFRGDLHSLRAHIVKSRLANVASDHLPLVADVELKGIPHHHAQGAPRSSRPPPSRRSWHPIG